VSRIVYFDCASGVSGDMLLGALVDLGLPLADLRRALSALPLEGYRLEAREVRRAGLRATKVDVVVGPAQGRGPRGGGQATHDHGHPHDHDHAHNHRHDHDHAQVDHGQRQAGDPPSSGGDRGLAEVLDLLACSELSAVVRERASRQFRRLAEVEAASHGTTPDRVHFHEVGAVDSIVDIVGGIWGLEWLQAQRFVSSPLNVGSGVVAMAHGTFPVPAPATVRLLQDVPVYGAGEGELTTPTGALLVSAHASAYGSFPAMTIERFGHGAGGRETGPRPNILRLFVGEEWAEGGTDERLLVLETEIDDMSPQLCAPLLERLLGAGALDAYFAPIYMKKGRPGLLITVLADPGRRLAVEELLFSETTTLGVRRQEWQRSCLERAVVSVETPYGTIRVKRAGRGGRTLNAQPEFDDCERAARERGVPIKEVWAAALAADRAAHGGWGER
jgi:uncharacterized protein (TIGR00299 family) protein